MTNQNTTQVKPYFVTLEIVFGEYTKKNSSIVYADNDADARTASLLGECHGSIEDGTAEWTEHGIADCGYTFYYQVLSCKEVAPKDIETLKKYLA